MNNASRVGAIFIGAAGGPLLGQGLAPDPIHMLARCRRSNQINRLADGLAPGVTEDAFRRRVPLLDAEIAVKLNHAQDGLLGMQRKPLLVLMKRLFR